MELSDRFRKHLVVLSEQYGKIAGELLAAADNPEISKRLDGEIDFYENRIRCSYGLDHRDGTPRRFLSECKKHKLFENPEAFTVLDEDYFCDSILMGHKRSISFATLYSDIYNACSSTPLMRMDRPEMPEIFARYYTECAPGCCMIVVRDEDDRVTGRTFVHNNVTVHFRDGTECQVTYMDKTDYLTSQDNLFLYHIALGEEVNLCKYHGEYMIMTPLSDPDMTKKLEDALVINNPTFHNLSIPLTIPDGYTYGVPYYSDFDNLAMRKDGSDYRMFAQQRLPDDYVMIGSVCAGNKLHMYDRFCPACGDDMFYDDTCGLCGYHLPVESTDFGDMINSELVDYKGCGKVPKVFLNDDGELSPFMEGYMHARQLAVRC